MWHHNPEDLYALIVTSVSAPDPAFAGIDNRGHTDQDDRMKKQRKDRIN
jgi:hypothetical protein